ncbi:class I SAM-dependent methyltransferase [Halospeciosus flavus]|uniref:Class I SAM-dependent methyltransferase n=2 Tax=Halospeciosus flavus TaxID=3032283 RepID=A0ABD5Z0M6_9EURY|nr:class I SAM-dependent methyltransferase [Halospeciosus flavus]
MGFHTFDVERAELLEDAAARYRFCSREELLGALALDGSETVADLGSGTGFYTEDVAPFADDVYGVDVQEAMHEQFREKGVPANVSLVTADVADLPFDDGGLDAAFSTNTYHEFASDAAFDELERVLAPGARVVHVDWSAAGAGEEGPPTDERFAPADVRDHHDDRAFDVETVEDRPETWKAVLRRV